jgi:hypothetical protein
MVIVLGLALLCEVAIGLDAVLEAVELHLMSVNSRNGGQAAAGSPFSALRGRFKGPDSVPFGSDVPPSTSWRSGNRPGRLDAYKSVSSNIRVVPLKAVRRGSALEGRTVQADDFSHGGWLVDY